MTKEELINAVKENKLNLPLLVIEGIYLVNVEHKGQYKLQSDKLVLTKAFTKEEPNGIFSFDKLNNFINAVEDKMDVIANDYPYYIIREDIF